MEPSNIESASKEELLEIVRVLVAENAELKKRIKELERANARSATPFSKGKRKPAAEKKKPGRKGRKNGDKGEFKHREKPEIISSDQVDRLSASLDDSLNDGICPECGKAVQISLEEATCVDVPENPPRLVRIFEVPVASCECGFHQRGKHEELPEGQHGATAHRVGPNLMATALTLHYHFGVTLRKVPDILDAMCGISLSQSAITQEALKLGNEGGVVATLAEDHKTEIASSDYVHTDDTGWKIGGKTAFLMGFGIKDTAYYQIRFRHRAIEVAEVISAAFEGVLNTDRSPTYDAKMFAAIIKQKCLSHILENLSKLEGKTKGRAKAFARGLKKLLREMIDLWHRQRDGTIESEEYLREGQKLIARLDAYLYDRPLSNPENNSMLYELGRQNDEGNLTRFLEDPNVEPTNNFAERLLRAAVIARKVSHCSKNERGANAYASFKSVLNTCKLRGESIIGRLAELLSRKSNAAA